MMKRLMVITAVTAIAATPAAAQERWSWNGDIAAGRTLEIKGINGGIRAVAADGNEAVVRVVKNGRRNDPSEVRMVVLEHANGVTICAVYPHRSGSDPNECVAGSGGRNSVHNNDVTVEWEVQVPRGVNLTANTVNGGIEATGLSGYTVARTVNGTVELATSGTAEALTVNGNIDATLGRANWDGELKFQAVNGSITVTFTGDLNAEVNATTVTGDIETDYPLQVQGRFMNRRIRGTVGSGGRTLSLATVNGSIELRRR